MADLGNKQRKPLIQKLARLIHIARLYRSDPGSPALQLEKPGPGPDSDLCEFDKAFLKTIRVQANSLLSS